ncbi:MAG: Ribonuclease BN [Candidatus Bathyarchaeota archaeon BA1]|nr:MAG: Ribonuclease BN [Candidatus Bathyarchaeota archaeon BA1]
MSESLFITIQEVRYHLPIKRWMVNTIPLKIRFLGGTREIGRIAMAIKSEKAQLLLDYGVMVDHEPGFPMHVPPREVDAIILTHSHLDHTGAIPIFHIQEGKPVYGTRLSFELTQLLISDFIHLSGYYLPYEYIDLRSMMRNGVHLDYRKTQTVGGVQFQLLDAGHLPGSAQVLVEADGKRLLYTGDYNTVETRLLHGADRECGKLDALVIEGTYADEDHPVRASLEKEFVERVTEVVENGGTVLIPAFSVGRSQEVTCILAAHHFEYSITIDGMAREANSILMDHTAYLRDPRLFMDAIHATTWVEGWKDRRMAAQKPGVIISPAGMLKGGPACFYIQALGKKRNNAVFLVSYQVPGTPGHELLTKGRCVIDGNMRKISGRVERFDFSSHCGASQLQETIRGVEGNPKVYVVHGAEGNCERFARWIREETGLDAVAPRAGDTYSI